MFFYTSIFNLFNMTDQSIEENSGLTPAKLKVHYKLLPTSSGWSGAESEWDL